MMKGMRVKLTFTFSVIGIIAQLFVTMSCSSERYLYGKKNLLIRVKGLCAGGGGVNIDN